MAKAILLRLGDSHVLSNAAWLPPGTESVPLGPHALQAGVLCGRHNEQLAPLDDVGGAFCDLLLEVFGRADPAPEPRQLNLSGNDLERWVLKVTIGAISAGAVRYSGRCKHWMPSEPWVRVLFGLAGSSGLGLCFVRKLVTPYPGYGLAPLYNPENPEIIGAIFEFMGVWTVVMPDSIGPLGVKELDGAPEPMTSRPEQITFENPRGVWRLNLEWRGGGSGTGIAYVQNGR